MAIQKENILLLLTIGGVVCGSVLGISLRDDNWKKTSLSYLRFPGDVFVQMLKMLILPLILSSIVSSLSSVDSGTAGKLGVVSIVFYFLTTMSAVILGIILVITIQPGTWMKTDLDQIEGSNKKAPCISNPVDTILDLVKSLFPENLIEATFRSEKVCMKFFNHSVLLDPEYVIKLSVAERAQFEEVPEKVRSDSINILGLVMFSVAMGITIGFVGEEGKPLRAFFCSLEAVSMKLISLVIWFSPIGITFLIAAQIVAMTDPGKELQRLMGYMITVLVGLFIHGVVVLPLLLILLGRRNPLKYVYGMAQALLTALATSSSSATLPLSIKCVEENNGVDPRVARFVLPLGATINMDGTALYEAVAAIYISQCVGRVLSLGEIILVSLTATLASIGAAGIPQAGIVTMIMVLIAIGLPSNLFVLILPVDFLLDRIRTTVNVHGDSIGAAVVGELCKDYLAKDGAVEIEVAPEGYHVLSQNASPDPSKKMLVAGNNHYENSRML